MHDVKRILSSIVLGWTISWVIGLTILIVAFSLGFTETEFSYPLQLYIAIFVIVTTFSYFKLSKAFSRSFVLFLILSAILLFVLMIIVINQNSEVGGVGFSLKITPWSVYLERP